MEKDNLWAIQESERIRQEIGIGERVQLLTLQCAPAGVDAETRTV